MHFCLNGSYYPAFIRVQNQKYAHNLQCAILVVKKGQDCDSGTLHLAGFVFAKGPSDLFIVIEFFTSQVKASLTTHSIALSKSVTRLWDNPRYFLHVLRAFDFRNPIPSWIACNSRRHALVSYGTSIWAQDNFNLDTDKETLKCLLWVLCRE